MAIVSWSWDAVHLSDVIHEDHALLDEYFEWLVETPSELSEETISKDQLQSFVECGCVSHCGNFFCSI